MSEHGKGLRSGEYRIHKRLSSFFELIESEVVDAHPGLNVSWALPAITPPNYVFKAYLSAMYDREGQLYEDLLVRLVIGPNSLWRAHGQTLRWPSLANRQVAHFEIERGDGWSFGQLSPLALPDDPLSDEGAELVCSYIDDAQALFSERRDRIMAELAVPYTREEGDPLPPPFDAGHSST
jgi:hypothetical protein